MRSPTIIPADEISKLRVERADGNLQIIGAPNSSVTVRCADEPLNLRQTEGTLTLSAEDDLILYVPAHVGVEIRAVEGDVDVRAFLGPLSFESVEGDLQIRNAGSVSITSVEGDLMIKNSSGDLNITHCEGDGFIKDIAGALNIMADGDLSLSNIGGNLNAQCEGDLILNQAFIRGNINCQASGDGVIQFPVEADATVSLHSSSASRTRVTLPGQDTETRGNDRAFVMGAGTFAIRVEVEGSLLLTGPRQGDTGWGGIQDMSGLAESINNFVGETVENAMRGIPTIEIDEAKINAKIHKVEDAMRKVEEKIRSAERRARHTGWRSNTNMPGKPPVEPPPPPVSSEEHMAVLRMLQEKKITIEEAETLLSALEGRS